jgi:hypothetical protein
MKTKLAITFAAAVVLLAIAYWFVTWNLNRSFQKADWGAFQTLIEASVGEVVTAKPVAQPGLGAIPYYQQHPEALRGDRKYFQTWRSAVLIANSARDRKLGVPGWIASTEIPCIPLSNRTDAWGRAFCIQSSEERTTVVSPGAQAIGSLDCGTLDIAESALARMVPARLNIQASGVLIPVLTRRPTGE